MKYWAVGANWGGNEDVSDEFLEKGIWYDGYSANDDNRYGYILDKVEVGDILLMKSFAFKFTRLKCIGKVITKESPFSFKVDWFPNSDFPKDFYGINYARTIEAMREDDMLKYARLEIKKITDMERIEKIITLLKFKKQVILQGPPGTGKTREAKLVAEELIKTRTVGKAEQIVDNAVKCFTSQNEIVKVKREERKNLLNSFYSLFPKEELKNLTLDKYCIGRGDRGNFCWWMERGLKPLGYYSPRNASSYLIYWKKYDEEYARYGFIKNEANNEEAIKKIANLIAEVVETKETDEAVKYLGVGFILKILNTYYPEEYFPINSENCLNNALNIFGENFIDLNAFDKNKRLNQIYLNKKKQFDSNINSYEFSDILFENFNLKEGEVINPDKEIISNGEFKIIQFHPSYSYEDFVRGIVAEADHDGNISYRVENKILAEFAKKAQDSPNGNFILIIDEINRANLSSVLGELIYSLEYRDEDVTSMYKYEDERNITLPKNLFIIGTMNTADRSVGHIDYAIRRRFAFYDILSNPDVITNNKAKILYSQVFDLFNDISPDFNKSDVMIGHSYFLVENDEELRTRLEFEIKPILREYLKDGIFLNTVSEKIEELNV